MSTEAPYTIPIDVTLTKIDPTVENLYVFYNHHEKGTIYTAGEQGVMSSVFKIGDDYYCFIVYLGVNP